jgi:hypothetical protein
MKLSIRLHCPSIINNQLVFWCFFLECHEYKQNKPVGQGGQGSRGARHGLIWGILIDTARVHNIVYSWYQLHYKG